MHYETVRFHLFHVKVVLRDQSVAPIAAGFRKAPHQRGFMTHLETNEVPVARLIGFEVKEITDEHAIVMQHAKPWERCMEEFFAILPTLRREWRLQARRRPANPSPSN